VAGLGAEGVLMIEFLKEPPIVAAIIALIGVTIIAPLVKKFYFDVQNRLHVEVRPWNYKVSEALKKTVEPSIERIDYFDPIRQLARAKGYMTVTITNISKRKISGVSVTANTDMETIWQIDDADQAMSVTRGKPPIDLGDIQPKHFRVIHIWCPVDISDFNFEWLKHFLRISANELDSVRLRFPMPRYLWKKYEIRFLITSILLSTAAILFAFYDSTKK
jgi:hypothetical protein